MVETTINEFKKTLDDQNELISELRAQNEAMEREILTTYQVIKANYNLFSQEYYQALEKMDLNLEQDKLYEIADELTERYTYPIGLVADIKTVAADLKKYTWEELIIIDEEMIALVDREHKFWSKCSQPIDPHILQAEVADIIEHEYFVDNDYIWARLDDFSYIIGKVV